MDSTRGVSFVDVLALQSYPSDISDDEWAFCVGHLALAREDAPQREHDLRAVFDALLHNTRTDAS